MEQPSVKRPKGITIAAWVWIVLGGLWILLGTVEMVMGALGLGTFVVLHAATSAVAVWTGINLLRLKAWARTTIEVLSWLVALLSFNGAIVWIYAAVIMENQMSSTGAQTDLSAPQFFAGALGAIAIVFAIVLCIMAWYLRRSEVREAIANARQVQASSNL